MMDTLVSYVAWVVDRVWPFPVMVIVLTLTVWGIARALGVPSTSKALLAVVVILMLFIPFGTPVVLIFGPSLSAPLIYHYGVPGQGVITATEETGNIYNDEPVERYTVMLQTANGERIATHFDSSDFNIYPYHNRVRYPTQGQPFEVRYLASRPQSFVMVLGQ